MNWPVIGIGAGVAAIVWVVYWIKRPLWKPENSFHPDETRRTYRVEYEFWRNQAETATERANWLEIYVKQLEAELRVPAERRFQRDSWRRGYPSRKPFRVEAGR
jgi:hypothetical protein